MGEPMDRSRRVFGSLKPFDEVFPDVEHADVEYTESGKFERTRLWATPYRQLDHRRFHSIQHGGLIQCSNPLCRRGGYELDLILSEMRRAKETERKGAGPCPGDEGSPKGRRRGRRCGNTIEYTLTVKYK
jgi:hypothetical protein